MDAAKEQNQKENMNKINIYLPSTLHRNESYEKSYTYYIHVETKDIDILICE